MRSLVALVLVLAIVAPAAAQPAAPCAACTRGDAVIQRFKLEPLRAIAGELASVPLGDPVTAAQYAHLVELRGRTPALARLGAIEDADLGAVAVALCQAPSGTCVDATTRTLRCLADRCTVELPTPPIDVLETPASCHQYSTHRRSPAFGLGVDWGNGWQRSRYPSDGNVWSLGIEGRLRLANRLGLVARVDRSAGRDEATDANGNGHDDFSTGSITRISALAGPSIVLDNTRFENTTRSLRLDLLGGYLATPSQDRENGPAAGVDLALQLWSIRLGARVVQGFGDAREATMVLVHLGVLTGSAPGYRNDRDCGASVSPRSSRFALGFDFPITGYGFTKELGYAAPGVGVEALWHLSPSFDALTRADLLIFPGDSRDRVIHEAVLTGLRIDHGEHRHRSTKVGFYTAVLGGYTHGAGLTPSKSGTGPVIDVSVGWGAQSEEGGGYLRLHGRFGAGSDNLDYRAIFMSAGFEIHFDPKRWRDRT